MSLYLNQKYNMVVQSHANLTWAKGGGTLSDPRLSDLSLLLIGYTLIPVGLRAGLWSTKKRYSYLYLEANPTCFSIFMVLSGYPWLVLLMQLRELQNKMSYPEHEGVHFFPDVLVRQIGAII